MKDEVSPMEKDKDSKERFAAVIQEHGRSMFRAARTILDCDADAEDAVGEAVLLAWQSFHRLKNQDAVRCWLLKITVNCAYRQRRKGSRVVYMDDLSQTPGTVLQEESPSDLWEAVLRLPEDQRLVLMLYYYEELSVAEIAKTLKIPQGTVKSRLSRGRERLRELLREEKAYGL